MSTSAAIGGSEPFATSSSVQLPAYNETRPRNPRLDWVDTAKAISIILVVAWHTLDHHNVLNKGMIFARMPLFFFVAGLFASKALQKPKAWVLLNRVLPFFYLYGAWVLITFASTRVVDCFLDGRPVGWADPLTAFVAPFETLWFLYALGIVFGLAALFRSMNHKMLLALTFAIYCISLLDGTWGSLNLVDRIVRLAPFFIAGSIYSQQIRSFVERTSHYSTFYVAAYIFLVWAAYQFGLMWIGPFTFVTSSFGILAVCALSVNVQSFPTLSNATKFIGQRTILIYVLHRIVLYYFRIWSENSGMSVSHINAADFVAAVLGSLYLGLWLQKRFPTLFVAPWVLQDKRASASA